jgi:uncharacterized protein (TIGR03083 family)
VTDQALSRGAGLRPLGRVEVLHLFPEERQHLLELLRVLSAEEWNLPTVCPGWCVGDIARHLLGDDLGRLSRMRDGFREPRQAEPDEDLVALVNRSNEQWVTALRRLSPNVVYDLLEVTGQWTQASFATLDLEAIGSPVSWAGPDPAPVWLDLAREYTERWHHQQQMRDAVGAPELSSRRLFAPVLSTFVFAMPWTYRAVVADEGATVALQITGEAGGSWTLQRENGTWRLYLGAQEQPKARVTLDQNIAWRLYTKGITSSEAERHARIDGDDQLAKAALRMVSVIG